MCMYNGIIVQSVLYGSDTLEINAGLRKKVDVFEMSCPRLISGFTMWDKMRNEDIRRGCGLKYKLSKRVDQSVMRWYGHIVCMSEEILVKRTYRAGVDGTRGRCRPRL